MSNADTNDSDNTVPKAKKNPQSLTQLAAF